MDPGAVMLVDVATGAVENVLDRTASAAWLDNDTLIITEVTPE